MSNTKSKNGAVGNNIATFGKVPSKVAGQVGTPLDQVNEDAVSQATSNATGLPNDLSIAKMSSINENLKEELEAVIVQMDIQINKI